MYCVPALPVLWTNEACEATKGVSVAAINEKHDTLSLCALTVLVTHCKKTNLSEVR